VGKTKCMFMSCHQIAKQYFKNVTMLRYFGMTVTNQIFMHEKMKSRLNFENAC
jgi:hypothetical protein